MVVEPEAPLTWVPPQSASTSVTPPNSPTFPNEWSDSIVPENSVIASSAAVQISTLFFNRNTPPRILKRVSKLIENSGISVYVGQDSVAVRNSSKQSVSTERNPYSIYFGIISAIQHLEFPGLSSLPRSNLPCH
jgi:hypothetical protein